MTRLIFALLFASALSAAGDALNGRWEGVVRIPGHELRLILDLNKPGNANAWIGSAIIPGLDVKGAPLSEIAINGSYVAFTLQSGAAAAWPHREVEGSRESEWRIRRRVYAGRKHRPVCPEKNRAGAG